MKRFDLDRTLERPGTWNLAWIEGHGQLRFEPAAGITLELTTARGLLNECLSTPGPFTISGRTSAPFAEPVTCEVCHPTGRTESTQEATVTFLVERALFGTSSGIGSVSSATFTMTALDEWVAPALPRMVVSPSRRVGHDQFSVALSAPLRDFQIPLPGALLNLRFFIGGEETFVSASFELRTSFSLELVEARALDAVLAGFIRPLEHFVTMGTGRVNSLKELWVTKKTLETADWPNISILFRPAQARSQRAEWLTWPRGLFSLLDVRDRLPALLESWLTVYDRYRTVCDQLFYTIYSRQYLESYFLSLVQVVEGYHRLNPDFTQHRLARAEYRRLRKLACAAVPAEFRDILANLFHHGNEVSLRQRLDELIGKYGDYIPGTLYPEERQRLSQRCANARNAIAHHLPGQQQYDMEELYRFAEFLVRLLVAGLMLQAGFSQAAVAHALQMGASLGPSQCLGA